MTLARKGNNKVKIAAINEHRVAAQKYLRARPNRTGDRAICFRELPTE
jgi:hypothetical protein